MDLETSSQALLSDVARTLNLHPTDPASHQLKAILQEFQQATSLKVNLPLMELQAAQEELEGFLQQCFQEISSQAETQELVEGLARKMSAHTSRVRDLVSIPELAKLEVSLWVNTGLAANQSLEANFFSGILEGVAGRLGLVPPAMVDPLPQLEWVYPNNGPPPSERQSRRWKGGSVMWDRSLTMYYLPDSDWITIRIPKQGG